MNTICAVVRMADSLVINTIIAMPSSSPPDGCVLVEVADGVQCSTGWTLVGGEFIDLLPKPESGLSIIDVAD